MHRWIKAGIIESQFEGDRVSAALTEATIPFLIKSFHDTAYDGLYIFQKGWAAILVPDEFQERAGSLIEEVKRTFKEEGQDEGDGSR